MYLNNYQYLKITETSPLILLIILSIFIRIPVILIFGDSALENEWKILVNNLITNGTLSLINFDDFLLPNLFMPPLYSYYLYILSFFNFNEQNYILLILLSQVLLASVSVAVFYKINTLFFSKKISFYSSLVFSFFPLYLYSCSQISSISLQVFFIILFFYFYFQFVNKSNILSIIFLSIISGSLILLRGEFILILVLSLSYSYFFFRIPIKKILLIVLIVFITISPYLIRNILIFETFTITKSLGYNLWKGNNSNSKVEGSEVLDTDLKRKIYSIEKDKYYRINFDEILLSEAIKNITGDSKKYAILFFKKLISFIFIDINSTQANYYNPWHYIPVLLVGITSLFGFFISNKKSHHLNYLIMIFFLNIILYSCFFILPRYNLIILPIQIIFTNVLITSVKKKFSNSNE